MTINLKNKTKLMISVIILLVMTLCIAFLPNVLSKQSTFGIGEYFFKVPFDWNAVGDKNEVIFRKNSDLVGGIQIINYYPDQPLFLPNHSEVISRKEVKGLITKAELINMNITQPAASGDTIIKNENHLYLIFENDKVAYDIYANSKSLSQAELIEIAKSFEHK